MIAILQRLMSLSLAVLLTFACASTVDDPAAVENPTTAADTDVDFGFNAYGPGTPDPQTNVTPTIGFTPTDFVGDANISFQLKGTKPIAQYATFYVSRKSAPGSTVLKGAAVNIDMSPTYLLYSKTVTLAAHNPLSELSIVEFIPAIASGDYYAQLFVVVAASGGKATKMAASPGYHFTVTPAGAPNYNYYGANMGMNLNPLTYYTTFNPFNDVAKILCNENSKYTCWEKPNYAGPAAVGPNGYPTEVADAYSWTPLDNGTYSVTWKGSGTLTVANHNFVQTGANSATFQITDKNDGNFTVHVTPPISDLHIMIPGAVPGKVYRQEFLRRMSRFTTVRFIDFLKTTSTTVSEWADRSWPDGFSDAKESGAPWEDIIAFANETGKDIFINVPHLATDNYVCRLGRLLRYGEPGPKIKAPCDPAAPGNPPAGAVALNANSKVYVELSDELWNWFYQATGDMYCMVHGQPAPGDGKYCNVTAPTSDIAKAALANSALPWDNSNPYAKGYQFTGVLIKRTGDILDAAMGDHANQIRTIINLQAVWPEGTEDTLSFLKSVYGNVKPIKYVAVAPYFDVPEGYVISGATTAQQVDSIFAGLNTTLDSSDYMPKFLAADKALATKYGLPVMSYEGGQGIAGAEFLAAKLAAQVDPRMYAAYQKFFGLWDQFFGASSLFFHYSYSGENGAWGSWGAFESAELQAGTEKWDALMKRIAKPGDANLDGLVNEMDCNVLKANWQQTGKWWEQGNFNHDGTVNQTDLAILNQNANSTCTVP